VHGQLSFCRDRRGEDGAVAIIVALCLTALLVVVAMVLDFGLVRVDRQVGKSAADSATMAGLHALNMGDGKPHPFAGVCTALRYLAQNDDRFEGITDSSGTWSTPDGDAAANGCTDADARNMVCSATNTDTWARFSWSGTLDGGKPLSVLIQSGYDIASDPGWSEDTLPAALADRDDKDGGCNQLTVQIRSSRAPGLGSLATSSDLKTAIRSVGRVKQIPGGYAPALLLLERHDCPVLKTGSSSDNTSWIHVFGALASNGISQPGTIHADSDGNGSCSGGSNQQIYLGRQSNGIVAYAGPLASDTTQPDPSKPGSLTSVASENGKAINYIYDGTTNVYGSAALGPAGAGAATKSAPTGRSLIGRTPVDERYRLGVKAAIGGAAGVFSAGSTGWTTFPASVDACKPTQAEINALALTVTSKLFIDCTTNAGFAPGADVSIPAGQIYFNGVVSPGATVTLPDADHVYIAGKSGKDAIVLASSGKFQLNTAGNLDGSGNCATGQKPDKAVLFIQQGSFKENTTSNTLRMCRTTVFLMGGQSDGCVPTTNGTAPTSAPCGTGLGSGQFTQNGGSIDWTAPDTQDIMTLANGDPDPAVSAKWSDVNGPEDLALWSESASDSSNTFNMTGGGIFHVRGVFMTPNAKPFTIGGGAVLDLKNAQFIARTIELNGSGTKIDMSVDPNAAVTLPRLDPLGLVR
jgi:Flp pilus assembly protein TadG